MLRILSTMLLSILCEGLDLVEVIIQRQQGILCGEGRHVGEAQADDVGHRIGGDSHLELLLEVGEGEAGVLDLVLVLLGVDFVEIILKISVGHRVSGVIPILQGLFLAGGGSRSGRGAFGSALGRGRGGGAGGGASAAAGQQGSGHGSAQDRSGGTGCFHLCFPPINEI